MGTAAVEIFSRAIQELATGKANPDSGTSTLVSILAVGVTFG